MSECTFKKSGIQEVPDFFLYFNDIYRYENF